MDEADESRRIVRDLSDRALRSVTPPDSGERDPREPTCACGLCFPGAVVVHEAARCGPGTGVPLPLAQRILAALEKWGATDDDLAVASELRAAVERKT
jgi:hypothetical protein